MHLSTNLTTCVRLWFLLPLVISLQYINCQSSVLSSFFRLVSHAILLILANTSIQYFVVNFLSLVLLPAIICLFLVVVFFSLQSVKKNSWRSCKETTLDERILLLIFNPSLSLAQSLYLLYDLCPPIFIMSLGILHCKKYEKCWILFNVHHQLYLSQ